ncbi:hypothetical protein CYMTET_21757 [Cymbomonas tetramitiformis]|uniref:Uncharacterized protein n=1 Tax=Cymbomonas tetramitiformis TaxID=36881 RepID=A0AAE0L2L0_9CHLO|nr:hypothetical protein CYMTET_21757 [Cymbomonas tetramitiformis]
MALNVQLASEITNNKRLVDDGLCMNSKGSWEEKPGKASQAKRDPKRELGKNPKATRPHGSVTTPLSLETQAEGMTAAAETSKRVGGGFNSSQNRAGKLVLPASGAPTTRHDESLHPASLSAFILQLNEQGVNIAPETLYQTSRPATPTYSYYKASQEDIIAPAHTWRHALLQSLRLESERSRSMEDYSKREHGVGSPALCSEFSEWDDLTASARSSGIVGRRVSSRQSSGRSVASTSDSALFRGYSMPHLLGLQADPSALVQEGSAGASNDTGESARHAAAEDCESEPVAAGRQGNMPGPATQIRSGLSQCKELMGQQEGRPVTPNGLQEGRPVTPNGLQEGRPMTPNELQEGRPMTPTGLQEGRPMTPTGLQEGRPATSHSMYRAGMQGSKIPSVRSQREAFPHSPPSTLWIASHKLSARAQKSGTPRALMPDTRAPTAGHVWHDGGWTYRSTRMCKSARPQTSAPPRHVMRSSPRIAGTVHSPRSDPRFFPVVAPGDPSTLPLEIQVADQAAKQSLQAYRQMRSIQPSHPRSRQDQTRQVHAWLEAESSEKSLMEDLVPDSPLPTDRIYWDDFKIIAPGKTVESTTAASLQAPYVKHVNYTHMDDILAESDAEAYRELSKQHQKLLDREISP